ncbi:MAG: division/cell wall cluster transcriptional repressor MraZ [Treponema sp.]|jgi:MraZ protein|nr:division/cell wall cluster transcriptional repressor MraZ [Treponema sp.]
MDLLTGQSKATLDDKGRVSLPSRMRGVLTGNVLILTKGLEKCIWAFPPEKWELFSEQLLDSGALNMGQLTWIQHRFIVPSQPVEIDKAGRIALPPSLREHAALSKDCVVCGTGKRIEIWSADEYRAYCEANEPNTMPIVEAVGHLPL